MAVERKKERKREEKKSMIIVVPSCLKDADDKYLYTKFISIRKKMTASLVAAFIFCFVSCSKYRFIQNFSNFYFFIFTSYAYSDGQIEV